MKNLNEFFGTKLNSILLLVLIILMAWAIRIMLRNEQTYLPFLGQNDTSKFDNIKFQILGSKDDLVSFSVLPGAKVHGVVSYRGSVKGGYFFEGNILVNLYDTNSKAVVKSNAKAKGEWMTAGPVEFEGNIDFSQAPKGLAFLEIHNDNASGLPANDKSIIIPVIVE